MAERDIGAEGFKEIAFGAFTYEWQKSGHRRFRVCDKTTALVGSGRWDRENRNPAWAMRGEAPIYPANCYQVVRSYTNIDAKIEPGECLKYKIL